MDSPLSGKLRQDFLQIHGFLRDIILLLLFTDFYSSVSGIESVKQKIAGRSFGVQAGCANYKLYTNLDAGSDSEAPDGISPLKLPQNPLKSNALSE